MKWLGSIVYGSNCGIKRSLLWKEIFDLKGQAVAKPWLIVGDFNVVKEKSMDGKVFENEFSRWILEIKMLDHPYVGSLLTWSNKREGDGFLTRKLDRALVNDQWLSTFPKLWWNSFPLVCMTMQQYP